MAERRKAAFTSVSHSPRPSFKRVRRDTPFNRMRFDTEEGLPTYSLPPWPVWSDAEVNAERWDLGRSTHGNNFHDQRRSSSVTSLEIERFEDPLGYIELPPSLEPDYWIRLHTLPLMEMYHTDSTTAPILDLATPNTHLLHSEVMRWIIAGIMNLYQLGRENNLELEGQEEAFHINSQEWKPWHHIYALCKVTKHATHIPHVNPSGKYLVRLFYMGCWRRITIDDFIPLDSNSRPLLPMSASGREIWPALLSKALLKVAALSWTPEKEILDFSVMACLTGWHAQELDLTDMPSRTIWWLCQKLLTADSDDSEERFPAVKTASKAGVTSSRSRESIDFPNMEGEFSDPAAEFIGSVVLCAVVKTPSPSIEHPVLITDTMMRLQAEERPPTPLWKTYRWKKWALEQGLIVERSEMYMKCVRMYSPLLKYQPDMEQAAEIISIRDMSILSEEDKVSGLISPKIQSFQQQKLVSRRRTRPSTVLEGKERTEGRSDLNITRRSISIQQQEESRRSSLITRENKKIRIMDSLEANYPNAFPEIWIKFKKLVQCVKRFEIYYRTKSFLYNLNVTDILSHTISQEKTTRRKKVVEKKRSTASTHISLERHTSRKGHSVHSGDDENAKHSSTSIAASKTERSKDTILYLLIDSMASKKLLFSLSVLDPSIYLRESPQSVHYPSIQTLLASTISEESVEEEEEKTYQTVSPTYYIHGESYYWQSTEIQSINFEIKTVATTCHLIQLREGLTVFRLWMKLPEVYSLRISSQTPFVLGSRETIQEILSGYSASWKQYGSNFSRAFNELIRNRKHTEEFEELLGNLHNSYLPPQIPKPSSNAAARLRRKIFRRFEQTLLESLVDQTSDHDTISQVASQWAWLFPEDKFGSRTTIMTKTGHVLEMHWSQASDATKNLPEVSSLHNIKSTTSPTEVTPHIDDHLHDSLDTFELPSLGKQKKHTTFNQLAGIHFLRKMFSGEPEILKFYPFRYDDQHHIHFADYQGIAPAPKTGQKWIPLVRFVVNVHPLQNPYCAVYLTTTLAYGMIEVINNDTLTKFPTLLGDIEPSYFPHNKHGYTIFAHGYEDLFKEHSWKIRLLTFAEQPLPHSCNWSKTEICEPENPQRLVIKQVKGHYIPNKENVIFKCHLTLEESQFLSLRTKMSNSDVEFVLKITWEDGDVVNEYKGRGELTVPVIWLEEEECGGPHFYCIQAQVLDNTWLLDSDDLEVINYLKEKALREHLMFKENQQAPKRKSSRKRMKTIHREAFSIGSRRSEMVLNAPSWILMLVVDQDLSATVVLQKDKRREEDIQNLKFKWEKDDPGRYKKSLRIRQEFLEQERYSAYLRGFVHAQGVEFGDRTKFLLEHLSRKESESKLERKKVIQDEMSSRGSESKLDRKELIQDKLSSRESESKLDRKKVIQDKLTSRESESKLDRKEVIQDKLSSRESESKLDRKEVIQYKLSSRESESKLDRKEVIQDVLSFRESETKVDTKEVIQEEMSDRESESTLDTMEVIQDELPCKGSESKLDWHKVIARDRREERRKRMEEFQEEYAQINNQFGTVMINQMMRHWRIQDHLAEATKKSKMMKDQAYKQRNDRVQLIKKKIEEEKRALIRQSKSTNKKKTRPLNVSFKAK